MTMIRMTGQLLEFINDDTGMKVVIESYAEKTLHGLTWFTVETYQKGTYGNLTRYDQTARYHMSNNTMDIEYDGLVQAVGTQAILINKEHVSYDTFKSLVLSLKV